MVDFDGGFGGRTVELFLVLLVVSVGFGGFVAVVAVGIIDGGGRGSVGVVSGAGVAGRSIPISSSSSLFAVVVFGSTPRIPTLDPLVVPFLPTINTLFLYPYQLLQVLIWHHLALATLLVGTPQRYVYRVHVTGIDAGEIEDGALVVMLLLLLLLLVM